MNGPRSPHENCRESRPVPFFPRGDVWEGVAGGIVTSVDINENMQFDPVTSPPFRVQNLPVIPRVASNPRLPVRAALVPIDANVKTLAREIKSMEKENAVLRKHIKMQDDLINGFCRMRLGVGGK